ncbi:MAG: ETC complex I subunit [Alphaproteobacteria bacterium]
MEVRIFAPSKNAMQSGRAKTGGWVIEFEPTSRADPDPLMGWARSTDTRRQVRLNFDTKEEAIAHAERNGWTYTVQKPKERRIRPKAYADNFSVNRTQPWTH